MFITILYYGRQGEWWPSHGDNLLLLLSVFKLILASLCLCGLLHLRSLLISLMIASLWFYLGELHFISPVLYIDLLIYWCVFFTLKSWYRDQVEIWRVKGKRKLLIGSPYTYGYIEDETAPQHHWNGITYWPINLSAMMLCIKGRFRLYIAQFRYGCNISYCNLFFLIYYLGFNWTLWLSQAFFALWHWVYKR